MSISAMKQALQALEFFCEYGAIDKPFERIAELKQAIAEAEKQEVVAWMWKDGTLTSDPDFADGTWTPLFTAPVHASDISQEPVDETAKDRHEWVGLTDEEVDQVADSEWEEAFVRLIEAKLKEKNT